MRKISNGTVSTQDKDFCNINLFCLKSLILSKCNIWCHFKVNNNSGSMGPLRNSFLMVL